MGANVAPLVYFAGTCAWRCEGSKSPLPRQLQRGTLEDFVKTLHFAQNLSHIRAPETMRVSETFACAKGIQLRATNRLSLIPSNVVEEMRQARPGGQEALSLHGPRRTGSVLVRRARHRRLCNSAVALSLPVAAVQSRRSHRATVNGAPSHRKRQHQSVGPLNEC